MKDLPGKVEWRSHGKFLFRVGEAKNPGPNFTFFCVGITLLRTWWPSFRDEWQADDAQWSGSQLMVCLKAGLGCCYPPNTPWFVRKSGVIVTARRETLPYTDNARNILCRYLHVKRADMEAGASANGRWLKFSKWNTLPENDFFPDLIKVRAHLKLLIRVGEAIKSRSHISVC